MTAARSVRVSAMDDAINLAEKVALLDDTVRARASSATSTTTSSAVVKVAGEFTWHSHDETDDFFLVLRGRLTIELRDRDVVLEEGELFVVPRGSSTARRPTRRRMSC